MGNLLSIYCLFLCGSKNGIGNLLCADFNAFVGQMDLVILADHRIDVRIDRSVKVIDDDTELFQLRNEQLVVTDDVGILVVRIVFCYRCGRREMTVP